MRILQLTPGTGSFLCGSCMRDNTLVKALANLGHWAEIAPLYLPFQLEQERASTEVSGQAPDEVHMGGINVYLQQLAPWMVRIPKALGKFLDSPRLLRFLSARANMTDPGGLGAMTLSVLRGEEGRQVGEVDKLMQWMGGLERPDVVLLSNAMLMGLARRIRTELRVPVLCTLQGEAPFLDALAPDFSRACWNTLRQRAREVDAFLPVSQFTGDLMTERLSLEPSRVQVVHNGIELDAFVSKRNAPANPTIAFLARMCADKGLGDLVDAFIELKRRGTLPGLRLQAGGVCLRADEAYLRAQSAKLRAAGVLEYVQLRRNLSLAEKIELLESSSVLSVPASYGESFGLYLLEAMAMGLPVVQPHQHGFPEIIAATGGGITYKRGAHSLADALEGLLRDPQRAQDLGRAGQTAVKQHFTAERMARDVARVCSMFSPNRTGSVADQRA